MDMSFWNYVLERRALKAKEAKAKETLAFVGVMSFALILFTVLYALSV